MRARWMPLWMVVVISFAPLASLASQNALVRLTVSHPGPFNLAYLPLDLAPRIGADRAEGAILQSLHAGGGGIALANLMNRNADFAVAGLPAVMSLRANGGRVVALMAINDTPVRVLMVRADLKGKVKRIADLKGRVIGVPNSSLTSKTASQQLTELLLRSDGVGPDQIRLVPAGQSWAEQSTLLESRVADAIMGDEPFASRLQAEGKAFILTSLADPATAAKVPGANYLHATLATREDMTREHPGEIARMVRVLKRTLAWLAKASPEQVVDTLGMRDPVERDSLIRALRAYPNLYSHDGRFSARQLADTELFFRATSAGDARAPLLADMVVDTWSGRKP